MKLRYLFLFLVLLVMLGMTPRHDVLAVSAASILVKITPENPSPGENTTISLNSYTSNLDSVLISWFVNGKNIVSGIGKKSFLVNAPASGEESVVTVKVALPDGEIEKALTLRPSSILLLWQAGDSYVPPFYKGKALPTPDSQIKIVAMPEIKSGGKTVDPKNLVYAWKQDYTNMQEASGYGKNSFTYVNDYLDSSNNISVTASTIDQRYSADASVSVGTADVKILFYKNDVNMGTVWEQTLSDGYKIEGDAVIEAAPYFISPKDIRIPILNWVWSINDNLVEITGSKKNILPLKVQEGTSGTSKIRLDIENKYRIFGTASGELNVSF